MKRSSLFGKQFLKDIRILLSNLNDIESWEDNIAKKKSSSMKSQLVRALDISGLDFEIEEEKRYGHLNRRHSCWYFIEFSQGSNYTCIWHECYGPYGAYDMQWFIEKIKFIV